LAYHAKMTRPLPKEKTHLPLPAILFTIIMVALLTFATHPIAHELSFLMVACIIGAVVASTALLPGSIFFTLALANLIAVYACFFIIILDSHFRIVEATWQWVGFAAPLAAFFAGVMLRRKEIGEIVRTHGEPDPSEFSHALLILVPLGAISTTAMVYTSSHRDPETLRDIFILSMSITAAIAFFASRVVAVFLLITGLLFESFFERMKRMIAPVFAFSTFYSFTVLVFAALYAGIDSVTDYDHFLIGGHVREITFPEALYYSLVTLATVGYGDIVPHSNVMRLLSGLEVVSGVLLLLFGFNEILEFTRESRRKNKERD